MARLPIQDPATATGSNKTIFEALQKALGTVPNMARVMATAPAVLQAYASFHSAIGSAKLSPQLREQIALLAAETNACTYCLSAHTALGRMAGLSQAQIDGARVGDVASPRDRAALQFARSILESRGGISDADVDSLRRNNFTDAEIAEIVAVVALNVFTNYFNRAFDVDVDFPRVEAHAAASR